MQQPGLGLLPQRTYEYSVQPTEDHEDRDISQDLHEDAPGSKKGAGAGAAGGSQQRKWQAATGKGPDYKPTALRWPFIGAVVFVLCVAIALIVYAEKAMPGSDSDYEILGLNPSANNARHLQVARADFVNGSTISSAAPTSTTALSLVSSPLTILLSSTAAALTTDTSGVPSITAATLSTQEQQQQRASSSASIASIASSSATFTDTVISSIHDASSTAASISQSQAGSSLQPLTDSQSQTTSEAQTGSSLQSQTNSKSQSISPSQTGSESQTSSQLPTSPGASSSVSSISSSSAPQTTPRTRESSSGSSTTSSPTLTASSGSSQTTPGSASSSTLTAQSQSSPSASNGKGLTIENITPISRLTTPLTRSPTNSITGLPTRIPISSFLSFFTTNMSIPESTISFTTTYTTIESFTFTSQTEFVTTQTPSLGATGTSPPESSQSPEPAPSSFTVTLSSVVVSATTKTVVSATATTIPATVIPSVGSVTITYYSTIIPTGAQAPILNPVSDVGPTQAVPVTGVVVIQGSTIAVVQTQAPTVVAIPTNQVVTQVVTPVAKVGVTQIGGSLVTSLLVITPSPVTQVAPINVVSTLGGTPVTVVNQPSPETIVTEVGGTLRTVVQTPPPQTLVSMAGGVPTTVAVLAVPSAPAQPISYTVVADVNGTPVTQVVVTTPVGPPYQPISYTVVNTIGGTPVTQVVVTTPAGPPNQPISYTVVNTIGGTPVTQVVVTTPAGPPYQPISYTVVNTIGGTPVTEVFVTTPTGGQAFQPVSYTVTTNIGGTPTVILVTPSPTSFVTTIDGTPITMVTTPPVTSYTTTVGGTLTTETLVTTPSGTGLITLTFVSTSGGTLSTYTSTVSPTTLVTTISGKLTTITSTPSPSTSFSTQSKATKTFTTTSTPTTGVATPTSADPAGATVVATKKVYSWNERDIFVGTFLPPLLGVALVIPLRIIDLNAKLYQPFQTLAREGGGLGAETLTMQYSGLMTFVTPVVTLMQGHPVPFLTTLIVGLASFMVPLATETIGLKVHGFCYLNTASKQCGPALGVSPTPAHILVGLLVVVIIMLLLVLFFVGKWATGLFSNPWNIAGIAALAGNTQVRIRQNSEGAMKRAVSQKQYGLGYFENARGREEHGIILMDESGRGLQDQNDDSDGSAGFVDGSGSKGSPNYLPFLTLRYPWRIVMLLFQLGVLIFVIYYHVYYHGKVTDGGRLWAAMNSSRFGVRFVSAIIGVFIAFCWQSFFISVSIMVPYQGMARRTLPAEKSILITPSTNPFSGIYSAIKQKHIFFFATSFAAILSEFLPVLLSNVPFSLTQTGITATVCTVMSVVFLSIMIAVLVASFFVRWPPMPVDPRSIAGAMFYVSQSHMLDDMEGLSQLESKERDRRIQELGKRYFYGVLVGGSWRRLGVDCDLGPSDDVPTAYGGNRIDEPPALHENHDTEGLLRGQEARPETG